MNVPIWLLFSFPFLPFLVLVSFLWKLHENRRNAVRPFKSMRRPAGYSLRERSEEQWERFTTWLTASVFSSFFPILAISLLGSSWSIPILIIGVFACGFCLWQTWNVIRPLPNMWSGLRGEQCVGAELDALQNERVRVFHDLVVEENGSVWNFDHIVLTGSGLLAIETKCRRKKVADQDRHKLTYDGHKINFPDGSYDTENLNQVIRQAKWLRKSAREWTGDVPVDVTPVLTYPGWFASSTVRGEVVVVNEKQIRQLLRGNAKSLDDRSWKLLEKRLEELTRVELPKDPAEKRIKGANASSRKSRREVFSKVRTRRVQERPGLGK